MSLNLQFFICGRVGLIGATWLLRKITERQPNSPNLILAMLSLMLAKMGLSTQW